MSGTLPIVYGNNLDLNSRVMAGALLRIYEAGTNTPVTAYKDAALTTGQEHTWPIECDAAGRLPMFWLPDGNYRARLSSADLNYIAYDYPSVPTVGISSGEEGEEGSGISSEVIHQPGDIKVRYGTGAHSGWVRANGRTIGSASSGATERANADTEALFAVLYLDTNLSVSGGRGASAAADFAANKTITLPDFRGRVIGGLDDMGNSAASRLTTTTFTDLAPTVLGAANGSQTHTLLQAQLPAVSPTFSGTGATLNYTAPNPQSNHQILSAGSGTRHLFALKDPDDPDGDAGQPTVTGSISYTPAGTISALGSGSAHNNVQPTILVTVYLKL